MISPSQPQTLIDVEDRLDGLRKMLFCAEIACRTPIATDEREAVEWTLFVCGQELKDLSDGIGEIRKRQPHS